MEREKEKTVKETLTKRVRNHKIKTSTEKGILLHSDPSYRQKPIIKERVRPFRKGTGRMKRRIIIVSLILMILCLLVAAAGAEDAGINEKLYAKQAENGLWGYSDAAGNWVIPAQYQYAEDFRGNYAYVIVQKEEEDSNGGIIDRSGEFVLQPEYFNIDSGRFENSPGFGTWDDGYYILWQRNENNCGFFDVRSGFFSGMKYEYVLYAYDLCDLIPVSQIRDGTEYMGYADRTTGELVVPYQYWISPEDESDVSFGEGVKALAPVIGQDEKTGDAVPGKFELVKTDGGIIQLPEGISATEDSYMTEGLIAVKDDSTGLYGYADISGNMVVSPACLFAGRFADGRATVKLTEDSYALIDREGKIVLREEDEQFTVIMADNAGAGKPRYAYRGENGLFGFVDEQGRVVMPPQFAYADGFYGNYASVKVVSEVSSQFLEGLIDTDGQWVVYPDKSVLLSEYAGHGLYVVERNGKCGFLDVDTGFFSGYLYDGASDYSTSNLVLVEIDGKDGYADRQTGEIRIPCIYDSGWLLGTFEDGYATVASQDGETLLIDENGKEYRAPDGTTIYGRRFSDGLCVVEDKESGLFGYMDPEGNLVIPAVYRRAGEFIHGKAYVDPKDSYITYELDLEGNLRLEKRREYISEDMYCIAQGKDTLAVFGAEDELLFTLTVPNLFDITVSSADEVMWYRVETNDKDYFRYGLVSRQGEILTEPVFDRRFGEGIEYMDFQEGLCAVEDAATDRCGYIDTAGNWVIPPRYLNAEMFVNGSAWVKDERIIPVGEYGNKVTERKLINQAEEVLFTETVPDTGKYQYDYYEILEDLI